MLRHRLLFGSLMILGFCGLVVLDGWLSATGMRAVAADPTAVHMALRCGLPISAALVLIVILSAYEAGRLCRQGGYEPATHWAAFVCGGVLFVPWIEMQQRLAPSLQATLPLDVPLTVLWLTGGIIGSWLVILSRRKTERVLAHLAVSVFLMVYMGMLGGFLVRIRCLWPGAAGATVLAYCILVVKSGDIGAYFTGRMFGRTKLVPWLSPGKTIEGAVGAVMLSAAAAVAGMRLWGLVVDQPAPFNVPQALIFGAVMAIVGHLGDLLASAIKRDVGSKDSGRVLRGFGGLLDICDSPVFAAPVAWILLTTSGSVG